MKTRLACAADIGSIARLHLQTIKAMRSLCPPGFGKAIKETVRRKDIEVMFSAALSDKASVLLTCEIEGELAGYALGSVETFRDELVDAPYLTVIFVGTAPRFRRQGVAQALLSKMESTARRRRMKAVELAVWANNNAAIHLYEKLGYQTLEMRLAKPLP